jgi:hypothetical protein
VRIEKPSKSNDWTDEVEHLAREIRADDAKRGCMPVFDAASNHDWTDTVPLRCKKCSEACPERHGLLVAAWKKNRDAEGCKGEE